MFSLAQSIVAVNCVGRIRHPFLQYMYIYCMLSETIILMPYLSAEGIDACKTRRTRSLARRGAWRKNPSLEALTTLRALVEFRDAPQIL